MPVNRNALIRYKTIDNCLRRRQRKWTLEDLIDACSEALYEYEGIDKGISKRTVQMDIQMMRSDKLGYNAPIEVYENKYYRYSDPDYSITNSPLTEDDMKLMGETVEMLRQFGGFSAFAGMEDVLGRLEDHAGGYQEPPHPDGWQHHNRGGNRGDPDQGDARGGPSGPRVHGRFRRCLRS